MASSSSKKQVGGYILEKRIGKGSFAEVWRGRIESTNETVAVKVISRSTVQETSQLKQEVSVLKKLVSPHIVRFRDLKKSATHFYLILEFCSGGDLSTYLQKHGKITENLGRLFLRQLASGLSVLHRHKFIHRDLKPQNILLIDERPPVIRIADFGFARVLQAEDMAATICGSPLYMAPEILRHQKYDSKADLYSVGAILYECFCGRPPFGGPNPMQLLANIEASSGPSFPDDCILSQRGRDFLSLLLEKDPQNRLAAEKFGEHVYVSSDIVLEDKYVYKSREMEDGMLIEKFQPKEGEDGQPKEGEEFQPKEGEGKEGKGERDAKMVGKGTDGKDGKDKDSDQKEEEMEELKAVDKDGEKEKAQGKEEAVKAGDGKDGKTDGAVGPESKSPKPSPKSKTVTIKDIDDQVDDKELAAYPVALTPDTASALKTAEVHAEGKERAEAANQNQDHDLQFSGSPEMVSAEDGLVHDALSPGRASSDSPTSATSPTSTQQTPSGKNKKQKNMTSSEAASASSISPELVSPVEKAKIMIRDVDDVVIEDHDDQQLKFADSSKQDSSPSPSSPSSPSPSASPSSSAAPDPASSIDKHFPEPSGSSSGLQVSGLNVSGLNASGLNASALTKSDMTEGGMTEGGEYGVMITAADTKKAVEYSLKAAEREKEKGRMAKEKAALLLKDKERKDEETRKLKSVKSPSRALADLVKAEVGRLVGNLSDGGGSASGGNTGDAGEGKEPPSSSSGSASSSSAARGAATDGSRSPGEAVAKTSAAASSPRDIEDQEQRIRESGGATAGGTVGEADDSVSNLVAAGMSGANFWTKNLTNYLGGGLNIGGIKIQLGGGSPSSSSPQTTSPVAGSAVPAGRGVEKKQKETRKVEAKRSKPEKADGKTATSEEAAQKVTQAPLTTTEKQQLTTPGAALALLQSELERTEGPVHYNISLDTEPGADGVQTLEIFNIASSASNTHSRTVSAAVSPQNSVSVSAGTQAVSGKSPQDQQPVSPQSPLSDTSLTVVTPQNEMIIDTKLEVEVPGEDDNTPNTVKPQDEHLTPSLADDIDLLGIPTFSDASISDPRAIMVGTKVEQGKTVRTTSSGIEGVKDSESKVGSQNHNEVLQKELKQELDGVVVNAPEESEPLDSEPIETEPIESDPQGESPKEKKQAPLAAGLPDTSFQTGSFQDAGDEAGNISDSNLSQNVSLDASFVENRGGKDVRVNDAAGTAHRLIQDPDDVIAVGIAQEGAKQPEAGGAGKSELIPPLRGQAATSSGTAMPSGLDLSSAESDEKVDDSSHKRIRDPDDDVENLLEERPEDPGKKEEKTDHAKTDQAIEGGGVTAANVNDENRTVPAEEDAVTAEEDMEFHSNQGTVSLSKDSSKGRSKDATVSEGPSKGTLSEDRTLSKGELYTMSAGNTKEAVSPAAAEPAAAREGSKLGSSKGSKGSEDLSRATDSLVGSKEIWQSEESQGVGSGAETAAAAAVSGAEAAIAAIAPKEAKEVPTDSEAVANFRPTILPGSSSGAESDLQGAARPTILPGSLVGAGYDAEGNRIEEKLDCTAPTIAATESKDSKPKTEALQQKDESQKQQPEPAVVVPPKSIAMKTPLEQAPQEKPEQQITRFLTDVKAVINTYTSLANRYLELGGVQESSVCIYEASRLIQGLRGWQQSPESKNQESENRKISPDYSTHISEQLSADDLFLSEAENELRTISKEWRKLEGSNNRGGLRKGGLKSFGSWTNAEGGVGSERLADRYPERQPQSSQPIHPARLLMDWAFQSGRDALAELRRVSKGPETSSSKSGSTTKSKTVPSAPTILHINQKIDGCLLHLDFVRAVYFQDELRGGFGKSSGLIVESLRSLRRLSGGADENANNKVKHDQSSKGCKAQTLSQNRAEVDTFMSHIRQLREVLWALL